MRLPERDDAVPCSGAGNDSAQIQRVRIAQTHLLEPTHPFFFLAANRPALLMVDVAGAGASPQVRVVARHDGEVIGSLCLAGPAMLPVDVDARAPSLDTSFVVTLPSAWVVQGLSLDVTAGVSSRNFDSAALGVGPEPVLTLLALDMMLFGDSMPAVRPEDWARQYLATLPVSAFQYSHLAPMVSDRFPVPPRSDGRSVWGVNEAQPALIATRMPCCNASDQAQGTCTRYRGFGVLNGIRFAVSAVMRANGMERFSQVYGALSQNRKMGGGLAGGDVGAGDDYARTFNHEMGHSQGMPHWGANWYGRVSSAEGRTFPYAGEYGTLPDAPTGGGFGNTWAYDYLADVLVSPLCAGTGKERQDPMQRSGGACVPAGQTYDWFSDYSAKFIFRYFSGAGSVHEGSLPYPRDPIGNSAAVPFRMPSASGKSDILAPNAEIPRIRRWNVATAQYVEQAAPALNQNQLKHYFPVHYNVPVVTFWGSFSNTTPQATTIQPPMHYVGYLKKTWNPSHPADFADLKSWNHNDAFRNGADLVLRVTYQNGSTRQAVLKTAPRGTDPLNGNSFAAWAVNFPDDTPIASAVLLHRPMEVRASNDNRPYNINYSGNTTTAANYLDDAQEVAVWP